MALVTINENGGGNFNDICKWDARAGRMFRVDKSDGVSTPVDITRNFKCLMDFESGVEVGWILFSAGGAPDFKMVPYGQPMPPRPSQDHKQGVRLMLKLSKECGDSIREIAGTANAFLRGINDAHDQYLKLAPANPGKLPVVVLEDAVAIESGGGAKRSTNYRPVLKITGWAPRPADMPVQGTTAAHERATTHAAVVRQAAANGTGDVLHQMRMTGTYTPPPQETADDFG